MAAAVQAALSKLEQDAGGVIPDRAGGGRTNGSAAGGGPSSAFDDTGNGVSSTGGTGRGCCWPVGAGGGVAEAVVAAAASASGREVIATCDGVVDIDDAAVVVAVPAVDFGAAAVAAAGTEEAGPAGDKASETVTVGEPASGTPDADAASNAEADVAESMEEAVNSAWLC